MCLLELNAFNVAVHLQGSLAILKDFGYSSESSDGLRFPSDLEPDLDRVANTCAELACVGLELELYVNGVHPCAGSIDAVVSPEAR